MWETTTAFGGQHTRRTVIITVMVTLLLTACIGTIWWHIQAHSKRDPFPAHIKDQTKLTLFYPTSLPDGYLLDASTIAKTEDVITYVAKRSDTYINFSIQPRAEKFDFSTFYSTVLTQSFKFTTSYGEATVGTMQSSGNTVGSLINADTWVIVSAPAEVKASQVQSIINDFATAKRRD